MVHKDGVSHIQWAGDCCYHLTSVSLASTGMFATNVTWFECKPL